MGEQILKIIANLLKVKSLVTMFLTVIFGLITLNGTISGEQFLTIFSVIIAFYFGTQAQKIADSTTEKKDSVF